MGEIISDYRYEDIILQVLSVDYDYAKSKSYSDRDLESMRTKVNNIYIYMENLSRSSRDGTKSVARGGAAMQVASSDGYYNCGELGHRRKSCPKTQRRKRQQPRSHKPKTKKKPDD